MKRINNIAALILPLALAYIFLQSGWEKIDWAQSVMENFEHWGYPYWFIQVIGAGEILGAILLLLPRTSLIGVGLLSAIMTGAVFTHLRWHEYLPALAPLCLIGLCAYVVVLRYQTPLAELFAQSTTKSSSAKPAVEPCALLKRSSGCPG